MPKAAVKRPTPKRPQPAPVPAQPTNPHASPPRDITAFVVAACDAFSMTDADLDEGDAQTLAAVAARMSRHDCEWFTSFLRRMRTNVDVVRRDEE